MKRVWRLALAVLLGGAALVSMAAADEASVVRGGRLYDDWSRELKDRPPGTPHPAFNAKVVGVPAAETWRCSECHGFDYRGKNGMPGIRARQGSEPAAIVALLKDPKHGFGALLHDNELMDLAQFVSHGQADMPLLVESARRPGTAPTSVGRQFGTICAGCHGLDGGKQLGVPPLGDIARQHPVEVLHVILNGHPGGDMPALGALGTEQASRLLGHLQTLPGLNVAASIAHGGRLYADWQLEANAKRQSLPHPAYPKGTYYANEAAVTWRCVACHGQDYQGNQGGYATGRNATGIKGIRALAGADPTQIVSVLRNPTHQFGAVLKARDLQDLANFVSLGQVDMDALIDRTSHRAKGNAERGGPYFRTICAGCHGVDGMRITAPLARVTKANPWGSLHTMLNGHPDESMPALREIDIQLVTDILAYVQGLKESR